MKFMAFVGTAGPMPDPAVEEMNRGWAAYEEVLAKRKGLRLGRELCLKDEGVATVRVRDGKPLITDGPFADTKEYVAGLDAEDWRTRLEQDGAFVLGGALSDPSEARTLRLTASDAPLSAGPFIRTGAFISGIEVLRSASLERAAELAATHPQAAVHAIEVRPFFSAGQ
jgi:hypothetical protein